MDDKERRAWSNLPATSFKREGVSLEEMSPEQRSLAHQLLQSTLSSQGYLKTTGIMHLDELLKAMAAERRPNATPMFGHDLYWIGIFGDPAKDKAWGWQLDGHHLALNITVVGDEVSVRPAFMGSDPARLPQGTFCLVMLMVCTTQVVMRQLYSWQVMSGQMSRWASSPCIHCLSVNITGLSMRSWLITRTCRLKLFSRRQDRSLALRCR